jgi:flagellar hook protein FlgE
MSVSTAMYAAITGLNTMGTAMSVISNNIANVNTIGFKGSRANFQDLLSQRSNTGSGLSQIGRGVQVGSVTQIFSQGSFQDSAQDTDIAISGEGFFRVVDQYTGEEFYTRAGNFIFDRDGRMVNPSGYILQGWEIIPGSDPPQTQGTPTDVVMSTFDADPEATGLVTFVANLDSREDSRYNNPLGFSEAWDATDPTEPIRGEDYVYQTSLRVYDGLGDGHDLTIYFDPHDTIDNMWDYIITVDPEEDARVDAAGNSISGASFAGLLQRGTLTFTTDGPNNTGGQLVSVTAENIGAFSAATSTLAAGTWNTGTSPLTVGGSYQGTSAKTYTVTAFGPASASAAGVAPYPGIHWVDALTGASGDSYLSSVGAGYAIGTEGVTVRFDAPANGITSGDAFSVAVTPASYTWTSAVPNSDGYFEFDAAFLTSAGPIVPVEQTIAVNFGARNPNGASPTWTVDTEAMTQYAGDSTTLFQTQDGYPSGYLQSITIDRDGVLTGVYTNNRIIPAFQIGLAMFRNPWGLEKVGNNLYRQTLDSGDPAYNEPGTGGVGLIAPHSLEQSNVDLAAEFVDMIIQQRGFQANSKIVTTTDTMLQEVLNMKR